MMLMIIEALVGVAPVGGMLDPISG